MPINKIPTLWNTDQKLGVYYDFQLESILKEFETFLDQKSKEWNINLYKIQQPDRLDPNQKLFIITALDEAKEDYLDQLIQKAQENSIPFYIFIPSDEYRPSKSQINKANLNKIEEKHEKLKEIYFDKILTYNDLEDIGFKLFEEVQKGNHPKVLIQKLTLQNIGHFQNSTFYFDKDFTCLLGLNGLGKTTILRAISIGLIGLLNHKEIKSQKITEEILRISKIGSDGFPEKEPGSIELEYTIDGILQKSQIYFKPTDKEIEITENIPDGLKIGDYLKTLVIGFAQNRAESKEQEDLVTRRPLPANPSDLIALIQNQSNAKLSSFTRWISDLDAEANKEEKEGRKSYARNLIHTSFQIFSEISGMEIRFLTVFKQSTQDLWVSTSTSQAISIKMLSQGFQSIMEWIGHFLQRMYDELEEAEKIQKDLVENKMVDPNDPELIKGNMMLTLKRKRGKI